MNYSFTCVLLFLKIKKVLEERTFMERFTTPVPGFKAS